MRLTSKSLLVAALSVGSLAASTTGALAYGTYGGGSYDGRDGDLKTVSYINPDLGAATENKDVARDSSCFAPDRYDMQQFSDVGVAPAAGNRNVHNDACFLDGNGNKVGKNIGASFQAKGVGFISACPDPDGAAGGTFATLSDRNNDGRNDSCFQSSYQDRGQQGVADVAGDFEYHARVNNVNMAGSQDVDWGMDRDADGRIDDYRSDSIKVDWSKDGTSGSSYRW